MPPTILPGQLDFLSSHRNVSCVLGFFWGVVSDDPEAAQQSAPRLPRGVDGRRHPLGNALVDKVRPVIRQRLAGVVRPVPQGAHDPFVNGPLARDHGEARDFARGNEALGFQVQQDFFWKNLIKLKVNLRRQNLFIVMTQKL